MLFRLCTAVVDSWFVSSMSCWSPINEPNFFVRYRSSFVFSPLFKTEYSVLLSLICRLNSAKVGVTNYNCLFFLSAESLITSVSSAMLYNIGYFWKWLQELQGYKVVAYLVTKSTLYFFKVYDEETSFEINTLWRNNVRIKGVPDITRWLDV